jgi:hypothetical protein
MPNVVVVGEPFREFFVDLIPEMFAKMPRVNRFHLYERACKKLKLTHSGHRRRLQTCFPFFRGSFHKHGGRWAVIRARHCALKASRN